LRKILSVVILAVIALGCGSEYQLKNRTRPMGYALGSDVKLSFTLNTNNNAPDSIAIEILETKTKYKYSEFGQLSTFNDSCVYICEWDGRKPDGSWPTGGRYYVSAYVDINGLVYSDTVEIGLTD